MKRILLVVTAVMAPTFLVAKGPMVKIVISGLASPLEISDPAISKFNPYAGPRSGFIINWSDIVTAPSENLPRYDVGFYVYDSEKASPYLAYVAKYVFDPSTSSGYVYLAGPSDPQYQLNHMRYGHVLDGHWFRANSEWQSFILPLLRSRVSN